MNAFVAKVLSFFSIISGEKPTVPPSSDHTDASWNGTTDIYQGELFLNLNDGSAYSREGNEIIEFSKDDKILSGFAWGVGANAVQFSLSTGVFRARGREISQAGSTVTVNDGHATNFRHDIVTISYNSGTSGTVNYIAGTFTGGGDPVIPSIPSGDLLLGIIVVTPNYTSISTPHLKAFPSSYWKFFTDRDGTIELWATDETFPEGLLIIESGSVYRCNESHHSSALFATDSSKWDAVSTSFVGGGVGGEMEFGTQTLSFEILSVKREMKAYDDSGVSKVDMPKAIFRDGADFNTTKISLGDSNEFELKDNAFIRAYKDSGGLKKSIDFSGDGIFLFDFTQPTPPVKAVLDLYKLSFVDGLLFGSIGIAQIGVGDIPTNGLNIYVDEIADEIVFAAKKTDNSLIVRRIRLSNKLLYGGINTDITGQSVNMLSTPDTFFLVDLFELTMPVNGVTADSGTAKFTILTDGDYELKASASCSVDANVLYTLQFFNGASPVAGAFARIKEVDSGVTENVSIMTMVSLVAGDEITLKAKSDTGDNLTVDGCQFTIKSI